MDAAPPPAPPQLPPASPAWPRAAQLAAAALLGAAAVLLVGHAWGYLRWGSRPTDLDPGAAPAYRVDLNRADRAELLQLPGVGPGLADHIETYRRDHGGFRNVDDLGRVRGVGPATLARLRPWVCVEEGFDEEETEALTDPPPKRPAPPERQAAPKKGAGPLEPIDINKATAAELRKLPGIGPKRSQAIIDERQKGPFKSADDLRRVHGIGAKTVDSLRPYVTVGSEAVRVAAGE